MTKKWSHFIPRIAAWFDEGLEQGDRTVDAAGDAHPVAGRGYKVGRVQPAFFWSTGWEAAFVTKDGGNL
mgnify:CR=1 FL=1